ncbi:isochorismatase family protein [Actinomadura rugatobispora]|uniref:Isochorismatase family protein n=1 Tax=Actinomadura rugatobispora TaxID=1994 RepID=A0ABW0ZR65_9ACTN|nr:isochorismatase family protein [Actinomadura rugatobispora]
MSRVPSAGPSASAPADVFQALTASERAVYEQAGYHRVFGLGASPALLVVDVEYNFTGDADEPVLDSVAKYPDSCGGAAWRAVPAIARLLAAARAARIPVVYTHGRPEGDRPGTPRRGTDIIDEIAPRDGEYVVAKSAASAFHGTDVAAHLRGGGVDTVVHAGCTTSGCVRASVVDAAAHGFRNAVVEECVFDRAVLPHQVNLFDMDAKYADVISLGAAENYLAGL